MFPGWLLTNKLPHSLRNTNKMCKISYSSFYFHPQGPVLVVCMVGFEMGSLSVGKL